MKMLIQKDTCTSMFTAILFTVVKIWKQPKCSSIDEWIKKMRCVYIYHIYTMEYYSATHTKKWNFAICNNLDGFGGYYAKWNKSDRERQILYDTTYMWGLKNKAKKYNKIEKNFNLRTQELNHLTGEPGSKDKWLIILLLLLVLQYIAELFIIY